MSSHSFFKTEEIFQRIVVASIRNRIIKKTKAGGIFRLALSGGSTPREIYKSLAKEKDIVWSKVEIFLVDERYAPLDDKSSNYKTIHDAFTKKPLKRLHRFDTSLAIPAALKSYEQELQKTENTFFDLVILGIGADGHTASLFPNSKALSITKRWVAHTTTDEFEVRDRLTLTYPALESSREIFFLLKGKEKRAIFNQMQQSSPNDRKLPAAKLFKLDKSQVFFAEID